MAGTAGTCFGYTIRSSLSFEYLRGGGGDPLEVVPGVAEPLDGEDLLQEWSPPRVPFHARLYGSGTRYRLWLADTGWLGVDPAAARIVVPEHGDPLRIEERVWGMPSLLCFLARGDVPVHAAAIEINGQAVLLAAPGRFGKTTLLSALAGEGLRVLTEDLACVRVAAGQATLIPGPAMLRLRRDIADEVVPASFREIGRDDDRIHLADSADRGDCTPVPISALVFLRDEDGPPRLSAVESAAALPDLWQVSFHLPLDGDRARCFSSVADLAGSIPMFDLRRRLCLDELWTTVSILRELTG